MIDLLRTQQLDIMLSMGSMTAIIAFFIAVTGINTKKKKALFLMEIGATILLLSARFCWMYNDHPGTLAIWMSRINNFLDYFGIVIVLFGFNQYLKAMFAETEGVGAEMIRFKINDILMALDAFCICISPFTGLYYSLDENNNYSRGPAIVVCFSVPIIILIIQISLIVQYYGQLSKNMRFLVLLFAVTPIPAAILQYFYYGLETTNISIVAMAVLLYMFDLYDINRTADMSLRAIAANEAKSEFLSNMSHEIRTPINAVLGMNEMILRESDDPVILSYSENIKTAGNNLLEIINGILDFSKIEAGKTEIIPADYDLSKLILDMVSMIKSRTEAKGLELKLDIDRSLPRRLNGDEVKIGQIITNILTNAVKYTEKGSITFELKCERVNKDSGVVVLKAAVVDTGIGIRKEDLNKLFSKFDRIEEKRNRNIEGTGLGLSIAESMLNMMGSKMLVQSVYGQGSTFYFLLEQKVVDWEEIGDYEQYLNDKKQTGYHESIKAPDASVLVVDDYEINLSVFKNLVKQTLIRVDTAESGDEGLRLTEDNQYDLIFLDQMMPEKDGTQTLEELRSMTENMNCSVPVICLTANAISGAREKYLSAGFDDYITKPIDPVRLEEMLIKYLPADKIRFDMEKEKGLQGSEDVSALPAELIKLKEQEILNISDGLYFCGSPEAYLKFLNKFDNTLDKRLSEINGFYSDRDLADYTIKVHALKSVFNTIGASGLGDRAKALEDAGKQEDYDFIKAHHEDFINSVIRFGEMLSETLKLSEDISAPEAVRSLMDQTYEEIRSAAEEMDCDRLDKVFAKMKDYSIPESDRELFERLERASQEYDYKMILRELEAAPVYTCREGCGRGS